MVPPSLHAQSTFAGKVAVEMKNCRNSMGSKHLMRLCLVSVMIVLLSAAVSAQQRSLITAHLTVENVLAVAIQPEFHTDYGCAYPLTYQIDIPAGSSALTVRKRYASTERWLDVLERTSDDFFNGIEAVRFDYPKNTAYVSVAFSSNSDSLFLMIDGSSGAQIVPHFAGITKYYDNRRAAVTVTADDWSDWVVLDHRFSTLTSIFRFYGLYLTIGIISDAGNSSATTWSYLQQQVDSGFVEVAAHSRSHSHTPYLDPAGEIGGCRIDITSKMILSSMFRKNSKQYVYVWIAPYGDYDATTDSLLAQEKYLIARLYSTGTTSLTLWNDQGGLFAPTNPTLEIGKPSWGGGDSDRVYLNAKFDSVTQAGGVYHFMWHPQVMYDDRTKSYFTSHLSYISRRKDILYANLGHLYLYQLMVQSVQNDVADVAEGNMMRDHFELQQNYPNPFNPATTISFNTANEEPVTLEIISVTGQVIKTVLKNSYQSIGRHQVVVEMGGYASGVYFCRLVAGGGCQLKAMLLLK